jgi:hypothetical protein
MARPRTGNNVKDVTLTLSKANVKDAKKLAFTRGISFSEMVDRLLVAEMSSGTSIAMQFGRKMEAAK